jgi:hypothetical protein
LLHRLKILTNYAIKSLKSHQNISILVTFKKHTEYA